MTKRKWTALIGLAVIGVGLGSCLEVDAGQAKTEKIDLPPIVLQAIKTAFPEAKIRETETEREEGLTVYEVNLRQKHQALEVTVSPDGTILEVESGVPLSEVSKTVMAAITKAAKGGEVRSVQKEEIRAEVEEGEIDKLTTPKYAYEARVVKGEMKSDIEVSETGTVLETGKWEPLLPAKALAAVKKAFPRSKLVDAKSEDEEGIKRYEAKLTLNKTRMEVEVTADGVIFEIETELAMDQVPSRIRDVLVKEANGGKIEKVCKIEIQTEVKDGKVTKLETPKIAYEAKFVKGQTVGKVEVDSKGTVLEKHQW